MIIIALMRQFLYELRIIYQYEFDKICSKLLSFIKFNEYVTNEWFRIKVSRVHPRFQSVHPRNRILSLCVGGSCSRVWSGKGSGFEEGSTDAPLSFIRTLLNSLSGLIDYEIYQSCNNTDLTCILLPNMEQGVPHPFPFNGPVIPDAYAEVENVNQRIFHQNDHRAI